MSSLLQLLFVVVALFVGVLVRVSDPKSASELGPSVGIERMLDVRRLR